MPNYPTVDIYVNGSKIVVDEVPNAIPTTPLADVSTDSSSDYILIVKSGVVKKVALADLPYDNTLSGLAATTVQGAIDELAAAVST